MRNRVYVQISLFGIALALLTLFAGRPDYGAAVTPFVGFLSGYVDAYLSFYFLTRNPDAYFSAFERLTSIWPYRNYFPFSLYRKSSSLFSKERKRLISIRVRTFVLYESYKIAIVLFLGVSAFLASKRAESIMFNWGLSIFFWALSYLLMWRRGFRLKSAGKLGIREERLDQIISIIKNNYGYH